MAGVTRLIGLVVCGLLASSRPARADPILYLVDPASAELKWFEHTGASTGTPGWSDAKVGADWAHMRQVTASSGTAIYAVTTAGDLYWYRHDGQGTGAFRWAAAR